MLSRPLSRVQLEWSIFSRLLESVKFGISVLNNGFAKPFFSHGTRQTIVNPVNYFVSLTNETAYAPHP